MPRTYPPQISQQADQRMHQLSAVIGRAKLRITKFQRVHDTAWEEAFSILDEFDTGEGARFIARDGHTMQRQKRQRAETLDEPRLHDLMLEAYGNEEKWMQVTEPVLNPVFAQDSNALFAKLFEVLGSTDAYRYVVEALSIRQVNPTLLSQVYASDVNLRQMTQEAMIVPEPTYARVRNEWTRDDQQRSNIFGIFKIPLEDREEVVLSMQEYNDLLARAIGTPTTPPEAPEPAATEEPVPVRRGRGRPRRQQ